MKRALVLMLVVGVTSGCSQYKRLIGDEPSTENIPPCSRIGVQDFSGSDTDVMAQLTFDQRNRLDSDSPFFDSREPALTYVRNLYNGAQPFPTGEAGFSCLDQAEFNRVVLASSNLGRFPL